MDKGVNGQVVLIPLSMGVGYEVIGRDALRMRLRRLCEKKKGGKMHVKESFHEDYNAGGERRELLELALLETLDKIGADGSHAEMKKEFNLRVEHVKERLVEREKEVTGEWLTKERMASKLSYSKILDCEHTIYVSSLKNQDG